MAQPGPIARTYATATDRWAGVGPYYAMFPVTFADQVVAAYSEPGDTVVDPFAGRGTAIFSAASHGRHGIGVELNPVGWVYAQAKLCPADEADVVARLKDIAARAAAYATATEDLPPFFRGCYRPGVLHFLLAARANLDWRRRRTDRTLAALLLIYLHGKREASLSNQMRQTKSLSPEYAMRWWRDRGLEPPDVDPVEFMLPRIAWRYAKGSLDVRQSRVYLGDSLVRLPELAREVRSGQRPAARLLITSPPYFSLTNYHYDQWIRLWLLGGPPSALRIGGKNRGKFEHREGYAKLLHDVFACAASILRPDANVYVRTDARDITLRATLDALTSAFPRKAYSIAPRPFVRPTQTSLFGDRETKQGEVDIIMVPK